jgi:hypothetical protein
MSEDFEVNRASLLDLLSRVQEVEPRRQDALYILHGPGTLHFSCVFFFQVLKLHTAPFAECHSLQELPRPNKYSKLIEKNQSSISLSTRSPSPPSRAQPAPPFNALQQVLSPHEAEISAQIRAVQEETAQNPHGALSAQNRFLPGPPLAQSKLRARIQASAHKEDPNDAGARCTEAQKTLGALSAQNHFLPGPPSAPSTTAETALLWARIRASAHLEDPNDAGARCNQKSIESLLQKVGQGSRRGSAFKRQVEQNQVTSSMASLPALHPETEEALKHYGVFPFARGEKVPLDFTSCFDQEISIDEEGDQRQTH